MQTHLDKQNKTMDYNQLAQEYALHRKVQPRVFEQLLRLGEINSRSKVLEVGCGTGNYISAIQAATRCTSWGIDPSSQMLSRSRVSTCEVDFRIGSGEELKFPDCSFDLVFSVDVIHHIHDKARYMDEAFRVLAPGGMICTVTESTRMIQNRRPFAVYFPETVEVDLKRYPTQHALMRMMKNSGFANIWKKYLKFSFLHSDIQDFRDRAYSCLHLISEENFKQGIARMEQDLQRGPIPWDSRYIMLWGKKC